MKKNTIVILAVAAVLIVGGVFVIAQRKAQTGTWDGPGMHFAMRHGGGGRGMMMGLRQLDLTSDQQAKVKEILDANKGTVQPLREQLKANHEKLAALGGNFDEGQVTAIAREQGDLMSQMIVARQKVKSQIFAILTDEQKAKATQLQQQMKQRFENRMKGFGGGDPQKSDE
jgi:Spy/CpxP family protein refolding chaperone